MFWDADLAGGFLDPDRHVDALHLLAVRRLAQRDGPSAFMFADRLCRVTRGIESRALLLRAEALRALNDLDGAATDTRRAFAIDPADPDVVAAALRTCPPEGRVALARSLLRNPRTDTSSFRAALAALGSEGYEAVTFLRGASDRISGRIVWRADGALDVQVPSGSNGDRRSIKVIPDPDHPFSGPAWHAADIEVARLDDAAPDPDEILQAMVLRSEGRTLRRLALDDVAGGARDVVGPSDKIERHGLPMLTVIVPLFDDVRTTQLCLLALARQKVDRAGLRVILIQDNPGFSAMTTLARRATARFGFETLVNRRTLGFASAVNRGLARAPRGDVVLLNSDVVLPTGALQRLRRAATAGPDIATVTPLSNNGEEASFPSPFHSNAMGSARAIRALDAIASTVNEGRSVTLINGVGFCLYVTRRALDLAGPLPEIYDRGYYEDVDFCLRARAAGLRNVCATDVYVGHKGASSFKDGKRALVTRNRRLLEHRYPNYSVESAAFLKADPLREARLRIERAATPRQPFRTLLFVPPGLSPLAISGFELLEDDRPLRLGWTFSQPGLLEISSSDGSSPQSLRFDATEDRDALVAYLSRAGVRRLRLVGPCLEQGALIDRLQADGMSVEILFEESLIRFPAVENEPCEVDAAPGPCKVCVEASTLATKAGAGRATGLGARLRRANRIRPTNAMADAISVRLGLAPTTPGPQPEAPLTRTRQMDFRALGILGDAEASATVRLLSVVFGGEFDGPRAGKMILLGKSLDDIRLMASGRAFVTGPVDPADLPGLIRHHRIGALFATHRWAGYGDLERHGGDLPLAYFDWSGGITSKSPDDLALDPRLCNRKVACQLMAWWSRHSEISETG